MEINFNKFLADSELDEQRDLFKECFPETINSSIVSVGHYKWKFQSKRGNFNSLEFVAKNENKIIGYYAAIPFYYSYFKNCITVAMVCDVMTGVKARGKGVFVSLGKYSTNEMKKSGFDISTGFPIRPEVLPGHLKAEWVNLFKLPLYVNVISFRTILKNNGVGFFSPILDFLYKILSIILDKIQLKNSFDCEVKHQITNTNFDYYEISEFYNEWLKQVPIGLIKDENFLKWRLGAPGKVYHIFKLFEKNKIVGILISCETIKEGVPCMAILDLCIFDSNFNNSSLLITKLKKKCKELKIELILVMISSYWVKKYKFKKSLFLKTRFFFNFIVKNMKLTDDRYKHIENWHLMWIDSDDL